MKARELKQHVHEAVEAAMARKTVPTFEKIFIGMFFCVLCLNAGSIIGRFLNIVIPSQPETFEVMIEADPYYVEP